MNRFNHVHLNVGSPGREVNPLLLPLVGFEDTIPPTIERRGIVLLNETGEPIREPAGSWSSRAACASSWTRTIA